VETFSDWQNVRCRIFKTEIPTISTAQILNLRGKILLLSSNKDLNDINGQDYFPILEMKISLIINGQDYSSSMCVKSSVES
jgi:hypothetical protein